MQSDHATVAFDLQVDVGPLFDWNTKQVFLYLYANYTTRRNVSMCGRAHTHRHTARPCVCPLQVLSQVVLWDKIVLREENPVIDYTDMTTKYAFFDDGFGLK